MLGPFLFAVGATAAYMPSPMNVPPRASAATFAPSLMLAKKHQAADARLCAVDPMYANILLKKAILSGGRDATLTAIPCNADADGCLALCDEEACTAPLLPLGLAQRLKVGLYFGLWFLLSVGYSVLNKRVTNVLPLPWSVATATVVVGSVFVGGLWLTGARPAPKLSMATYRALIPIGAFHAIGHIAGTVGTAAGSVSFAQVVKAAGPVYACGLSALVLKEAISKRVWLSLLPVVAGVALATLKELSFAWAALLGAVVSDLALALRNVLSKQSMGVLVDEDGEKIAPAQIFGVLTVVSALVSLPAALLVEGPALAGAWKAGAAATAYGSAGLAAQIGATGLFFYSYSEVAMKALANVHPITHAVGNTMRRVVIMLVCMVAFNTRMTPLGAAGSSLAIGGSYLYAVTKHAEKVAAQKAEEDAKLVEKALATTPLEIVKPAWSSARFLLKQRQEKHDPKEQRGTKWSQPPTGGRANPW